MQKLKKNQESKITLDIGGKLYSTSKSTLCSKKDSMLAAMFSGRYELAKSENGAYFIDADGTYFGIILDYLRGKIQYLSDLPERRSVLLKLRKEADFYNLVELKDIINMCLSQSDSIVKKLSQCIKISGADEYSTIKEMDFRRHDFSNSSFKNITFIHKVDFEYANFTEAMFFNCIFYTEVSFKNAELIKTKFINCRIGKGALMLFDEANLEECSFGENNSSFSKMATVSTNKTTSKRHIFRPTGLLGPPSICQFQFASINDNPKRNTYSLESYIETMSFYNTRNIKKANFPKGKLEIILRADRRQ